MAKRLALAEPENDDWQADLAACHNQLGNMLIDNDLQAARDTYEASFAIRRKLADRWPNDQDRQRSLAISHDKIGNVLVKEGKLPKALETY